MAGIIDQLTMCEEFSTLSDMLDKAIAKSRCENLPKSYLEGSIQEINTRMKNIIHQRSGGLYYDKIHPTT